MAAAIVEALEIRMAGETDPRRRVEALVLGLADIVKASSNDQNVQRLSRELRAAAADLGEAAVPAQSRSGAKWSLSC